LVIVENNIRLVYFFRDSIVEILSGISKEILNIAGGFNFII